MVLTKQPILLYFLPGFADRLYYQTNWSSQYVGQMAIRRPLRSDPLFTRVSSTLAAVKTALPSAF